MRLMSKTGQVMLIQRFSAFLNGVNDGVSKGNYEEKPAIIQTYWLQFRP